jgi:hypothetical protein
MVLWQGTPHMTILVSKRCFALRNHLVFHFKSELKSKREGSKSCFPPSPALTIFFQSRMRQRRFLSEPLRQAQGPFFY